MDERRYPVLASLLLLTATCTALAGLRWLWSVNVPEAATWLWTVCCPMLGMNLAADVAPITVALLQSILAALALHGLGRLAVRLWKTRRFAAGLRAAAIAAFPDRLQRLASHLGLARHVVVITAPQPLAFCFGLLCPRICVSTGLIEALSDAELMAVLLHEDHHRRRLDPLRGLVADVFGATFALLPVAGELRELIPARSELAADDHAVRHAGRSALAGALHKILTHPLAVRPLAAVGVSHLSVTETRIAHLLGERGIELRPSAEGLLTSSALLVGGCLLLQLPAF